MPLILAIEPDRRQASQLTAMVRGRLHAELVLGESAERALAALGQRVPDLILTSALLSPKDETALGERLRALDGAAAHVQTLTIPVLASSSGRGVGRAGGVLSALRRDKTRLAASDGCDPGVFAEQCKEYLERAATERALLAEQAALAREKTTVVAKPAEPKRAEEPLVKPRVEPLAEQAPAPLDAPGQPQIPGEPVVVAKPPAPTEPPAPAALRVPPAPVETLVKPRVEHSGPDREKPAAARGRRLGHRWAPDDSEGPSSLLAAVAALEAEQEVQVEPLVTETPFDEQSTSAADETPFRANPFHDSPSSANPFDPRPSGGRSFGSEPADALETESTEGEEIDLSSLLDDSGARTGRIAETFEDEPAAIYEIDNTLLTEPVDDPLTAAAPAADATAGTLEPDEIRQWTDILEALRRDAEQVATPVAPAANDSSPGPTLAGVSFDDHALAEPTPAADPSRADDSTGKKKKKRSKNGPAQDEWGLFDPDQCGFAALIEKLEEITDEDETPAPKPKRA